MPELPDLPLIPASRLALLVIVFVIVVPLAMLALAAMNVRSHAQPATDDEIHDFWRSLLTEQRERGAVLGTPEPSPIASTEKSAPAPITLVGSVPARSPYAYRADMTLAELIAANRARAAKRRTQRRRFEHLVGVMPTVPSSIGRHRLAV